MIQFNLLPDVKLQYIRAQRIKRLVIAISFLASAAALFVFVVSVFSVYIVQKKSIHDLASDIKTNSATLQGTANIADILTVQSQLNSLSSLNAQKPTASRLFGFLSQVTPQQITISDLKVDFAQHTMTISGDAKSFDLVNIFVDSLKFTSYSVKGTTTSTPAFSGVVLSSFSRSAKSATYSISLGFDPIIFNNANDVTLSVGAQSNANAQQPSIIFKRGQ